MEDAPLSLSALAFHELVIASAHRTPDKVHWWAETAADRGPQGTIAAAGKAAFTWAELLLHLPTACRWRSNEDLWTSAAWTPAFHIVQMPSGVPVACVAINGALKRSAIYATRFWRIPSRYREEGSYRPAQSRTVDAY